MGDGFGAVKLMRGVKGNVIDTTKACSKCGIEKPRDAFYINKALKSGLTSWCVACQKNWTIEHPEFAKAWRKKNYAKNKEKRKEEARQYRLNYPDKVKATNRNKRFKNLYGISLVDYNAMFVEQSGLCGICGKPEARLNKKGIPYFLSVDHDHTTGTVRKLLCYGCNSVLGYIKEDPLIAEAIVQYLKTWGRK